MRIPPSVLLRHVRFWASLLLTSTLIFCGGSGVPQPPLPPGLVVELIPNNGGADPNPGEVIIRQDLNDPNATPSEPVFEVLIGQLSGVFDISFSISFDSAILKLERITRAPSLLTEFTLLWTDVPPQDQQVGPEISIGLTRINPLPEYDFPGPTLLLKLQFQAQQEGSFDLCVLGEECFQGVFSSPPTIEDSQANLLSPIAWFGGVVVVQ